MSSFVQAWLCAALLRTPGCWGRGRGDSRWEGRGAEAGGWRAGPPSAPILQRGGPGEARMGPPAHSAPAAPASQDGAVETMVESHPSSPTPHLPPPLPPPPSLLLLREDRPPGLRVVGDETPGQPQWGDAPWQNHGETRDTHRTWVWAQSPQALGVCGCRLSMTASFFCVSLLTLEKFRNIQNHFTII